MAAEVLRQMPHVNGGTKEHSKSKINAVDHYQNLANDVTNKAGKEGDGIANGVADGVTKDLAEIDLQDADMSNYEPIAIIGCGMRLPGDVRSGEALWNLLDSKRDGRCRVPPDRYNIDAFHGPGKLGHVSTEHGYFLDYVNLAEIDTSFWSTNGREVGEMDPQQRLALEVVYECLQNSGTTAWKGRKIGAYVGIFGQDWADMMARDTHNTGIYRLTGYGDFFVANRISYEFGFEGPSMVIRTACSSSLTGLHEACLGIHKGECDSAMVVGTNLIMQPDMTIAASEQGLLAPDGRCKTFDESADGYARGEAVVAVHIKKLSDAVRDNDPIRAVIRSSCANADGRTSGLSQPSSASHEALMRRSHKLAGIRDVSNTAMIECHGTGTYIGDPLESMAVARVFGDAGVFIGSIKPNVGHSEGASGVTAIIKMMLALERRLIPPNINFKTPNTKIPFEKYKLKVPTETLPWPADRAERVGVNSYGIGGSNAHILLESAASMGAGRPPYTPRATQDHYLLTFSASHPTALTKLIQEHETYLRAHPERISDLSYTLNVRRQPLQHRAFSIVKAGSVTELLQISPVSKAGVAYELTYVFTGQGAQWARMGASLLESNETFRKSIDEMELALDECEDPPDWSLAAELLKPEKTTRLSIAEFSQPCCTAVQVALVNVLRTWNLKPSAVVGHSSGEIGAAYAAGALTAAEAIRIAYYRGQVTKEIKSKGGMAATGLGRSAVAPFLKSGVIVGCENSPNSTTLSGDLEVLEEVMKSIEEAYPETLVRTLRVDCAYHSHHMKAVKSKYTAAIGDIQPREPDVAFFSSVLGTTLDRRYLDAEYWAENLVSPVLFSPAITELLKRTTSPQVFLEVGPHSALAGPLRQILRTGNASQSEYISTLVRGEDAVPALLNCVGNLFQRGIDLNWGSITPAGVTLVDLPTYPWQREGNFWNESRLSKGWRLRNFPKHDLLGSRVIEASGYDPTWRNLLKLDDIPWVRDHDIAQDIVFPGAGYVAMAGEAIRQLTGSPDFTVREVTISSALVLHEGVAREAITHLSAVHLNSASDAVWYDFTISSLNGEVWTKHVSGQVRGGSDFDVAVPQIKTRSRQVSSNKWYSVMKRFGLNYGPRFQRMKRITADVFAHEAVASIDNSVNPSESVYAIHPSTIDCTFQLFSVAAAKGLSRLFARLCVPTFIEELYIKPTSDEILVEASTESTPKGAFQGDAVGISRGETVFYMKKLKLSPLADAEDARGDDPHAAVELVWKPDLHFVDNASLMPLAEHATGRGELSFAVERMALASMIESSYLLADKEPHQPFLSKYRTWLDKVRQKALNGAYPHVADCQEIARMSSTDRRALIESSYGEMASTEAWPISAAVYRIFHASEDIFLGNTDALEVLMEDDVLTKVYDFGRISEFRDFLMLLAHDKPNLKILEVGAGTGGLTSTLLPHLKSGHPESPRNYFSYVYSDVSAGFFASAKDRFKDYDAIEYKLLDISKDPMEQGFEPESFDLIVASNVLHATSNLRETLSNVRKLLSPKGRLFLQELSPPVKWVNFVMGTFHGWWLGEDDGRVEEPYISPSKWDKVLRQAGFDGVHSLQHGDCFNANMVALPARPAVKKQLTLIVDGHLTSTTNEAASVLRRKGYQLDICVLGETPPSGQDIIALVDVGGPFLHNIDEKGYLRLHEMLQNCKDSGILWVTGAAQVKCSDPRYGMVLGMARTLRNELSLDIGTLELEKFDSQGWEALAAVLPEFQRRAHDCELSPSLEWAFVDGLIQIPRFHWTSVNKQLLAPDSPHSARKLQIGKRGFFNSLYWKQHNFAEPERDCVQVRNCAVGLNPRDVLMSMGVVDESKVEGEGLGLESAGIVEKVGPEVKDLAPGDRCVVLATGTFSTTLTTTEDRCVKLPDSLSFVDAASMAIAYSTAFYSLTDIARVEKGQVFCSVGSDEKTTHLVEGYDIPKNRIFNSRDLSFQRHLLEATNGHGVDIALNFRAGEMLHASWKCVAEFGSLLHMAERDLAGKGSLPQDLFGRNRSCVGLDFARVCSEKPWIASRVLKKTMELYEQGDIRLITPVTNFDATEVEDAMRFMQKGDHIGSVVVTLPQDTENLPTQPSKQKFQLRDDASYLLVGGLGGLGQAIAVWMAEAGCREIIFLSRSAKNDERYSAFVQELSAIGCTAIMVQGSVVDAAAVETAISYATKPVRGIIQASMVLRDTAFPSMSFEDWQAAVGPKVEGTWNLHKVSLRQNLKLDFLLLFSSWSGLVGLRGQANYASGNSFLDAFTQYRRGRGLPAVAIDIGVMEDIGYVSRNTQVLENFRMTSTYVLYEQDLLDSLQLMIQRSMPPSLEHAPLATTVQKPGSYEYISKGQLALGVRSTQRLSAPNNRTVWKNDPRMALYHNMESQDNSISAPTNEQLKQFIAEAVLNPSILDTDEAVNFLATEIGKTLSSFMMRSEDSLSLQESPNSLGVDSLLSIELRNWFRSRLGFEIAVLEILNATSILDLGKHSAEMLKKRFASGDEQKTSDQAEREELKKYFDMKAP
ncbi:MAG: hypothetical protein Q9157_003571 [Trypethelium eluteriae]